MKWAGQNIGQRVALFRSFFRGREDVYARRWQSADGSRAGYMPASLKDWDAINRSRPEDRKRVDQATRTLLPLTDTVIEGHLSGRETVGIYPLLQDETCQFLAVDFDKQTWTDDARAFLSTCQDLNVPAALERSRSGNGGHVWIFFDQALPASTARKLGSLLLTRTMERAPSARSGFIRSLVPQPRHDTQRGFRELDRASVAVRSPPGRQQCVIDSDLQPYPDQWLVPRVAREDVGRHC